MIVKHRKGRAHRGMLAIAVLVCLMVLLLIAGVHQLGDRACPLWLHAHPSVVIPRHRARPGTEAAPATVMEVTIA